MTAKKLTYEAAMTQLETLAGEMENGIIPIDQLSTRLKRAKELLTFCRSKLTMAEDQVQELLDQQ